MTVFHPQKDRRELAEVHSCHGAYHGENSAAECGATGERPHEEHRPSPLATRNCCKSSVSHTLRDCSEPWGSLFDDSRSYSILTPTSSSGYTS
jgi:hypothetical protein